MNFEQKIELLQQAVKNFELEPVEELRNQFGLCWYFRTKHNLKPWQIVRLLGSKYSTSNYTITPYSQEDIWSSFDPVISELRYVRADWCRDRIKELQEEIEK